MYVHIYYLNDEKVIKNNFKVKNHHLWKTNCFPLLAIAYYCIYFYNVVTNTIKYKKDNSHDIKKIFVPVSQKKGYYLEVFVEAGFTV